MSKEKKPARRFGHRDKLRRMPAAEHGEQPSQPEPEHSPVAKAAILDVVNNQLRDGTPPETRQTLERLLAAGHSEQQAREMIGAVVASEIWHVLKEKRPYDGERYVAALLRLPKMPWDD